MPPSYRIEVGCVILLMIFASLGCEAVPSAIPSATPYYPATPTFTPTLNLTPRPSPSPTATPTTPPIVNTTPTRCRGFMWAYGTVSPEFTSQVQDAMRSAGVEGSVGAGTFGETDSCGNYYGAKEVDYGFTLKIGEFDTREDLARKLVIIQNIARRFLDKAPAHQLGNLGVTFKRGELQCSWRFEDETWKLSSMTAANSAGCQLPVNDPTGPPR